MPHGVSTFLGLELVLKHSGRAHLCVDSRKPSVLLISITSPLKGWLSGGTCPEVLA